MNILADEQIPLLEYFFAGQANVLALPYTKITPEQVSKADILLVRSQFKVGEALLQNSRLKFIGSCVTGTDHLDIDYFNSHNIPWYAAQGCNTQSVVEYVLSVIAALQDDGTLPAVPSIGIIGVGRIGSRLQTIFQSLGYSVLLYDPVRAEKESDFPQVSLNQLSQCDVISLHTPLTLTGPYHSYHLIDRTFLQSQKRGSVIINTSRGAVIDSQALLEHGKDLNWCLDVYENEPEINLELVKAAYLATPHIAGHSAQGKQRGTEYVYQAAAKLFQWPLKSMPDTRKSVELPESINTWQQLVLKLMDPRLESERMKQALFSCSSLEVKTRFSELRKSYPERFELDYIKTNVNVPKVWRTA